MSRRPTNVGPYVSAVTGITVGDISNTNSGRSVSKMSSSYDVGTYHVSTTIGFYQRIRSLFAKTAIINITVEASL